MGIKMDSSSEQHHYQEMSSQTLESILGCPKLQQERKPRPADMQAINCPRCDSTNTKFCYYNNYSLSQPRYFCKSCRRYWTKGGTLRNVPVGGGCRKNKRSSSSSSSSSPLSSSSSKRSHDQPMTTLPSPIPSITNAPLSYDSNDLTLAIARLQRQSDSGQALGSDDRDCLSIYGNQNMPHRHYHGDHVLGLNVSSFDGLRSDGGFLENPTISGGIQGLYYGMGNVGMGMSGAQEMGIPFEDFGGGTTMSTAVTTIKQEARNGGRDGEGRVTWGLPWQCIGGNGNGADFESSRPMNWNGIKSPSNWHGFLNSPLV